ncbi:DUF2955 domain-containing protein [Photobacterium sp. BZF1]|uniref:DUF2955 domain-containing protein n=1 Tax=Photobacterium sp. BZF1 TaxID=1904457 RepID=UPI00165351CD|nr:DUF2955 domain-containing protein [Photobacterium sp. BZF1]MBC7003156.1 DUF2955 domain-containing protein [Photobacterium sp. BZF1]
MNIGQKGITPQLQLTLTFTVCVAITLLFDWPFSFFCPLFSLHIMMLQLPSLQLKGYGKVFITAAVGAVVGALIAKVYSLSPLIFLLIIAAVIFTCHRFDRLKPNPIHAPIRVVAIVLVSAIGIVNQALIMPFTISLLLGLAVAMVVCYLMYILLPTPIQDGDSHSETDASTTPIMIKKEWAVLAVFMPLLILFTYTDLKQYYMVIVAVSVISFYPEVSHVARIGWDFLRANLLGGALAVAGYITYTQALSVISSEYLLPLAVVFLSSLLLTAVIYNSKAKHLAHYSLTPFALLLLQADRFDFNIYQSYQFRLLSVFTAVVYTLVVCWLISCIYRKVIHRKTPPHR